MPSMHKAARVTPTSDTINGHDAPLPRAPRGCFRRSFLLWLLPVLRRGWTRPLGSADIPRLGQSNLATPALVDARHEWSAECARNPQNPSLLRVIWRMQRGSLALGLLASVVQGVCNCVVRPLLLRAVVRRAMDQQSSAPTQTTLLLVLIFAAMVFLEGFLQCQLKQLLSCDAGTRFIAWITCIINAKTTRLSTSHLAAIDHGGSGSGQASPSSLIGNDVVRTFENWKWACLMVMCISGMLGGVVVLLYILGNAALCGLGVMLSVMALNWKLSGRTKRAEAKALGYADERLGLLQEVISSIKAVKLLGWEEPYLNEIHSRRRHESHSIRTFRLVATQTLSLGRACPVLATCASIAYVTLRGGTLAPPDVFATISAFQALRMPMIMISFSIINIANIMLSLERIRRFLLLPERGEREVVSGGMAAEDALQIDNARFVWPEVRHSDGSDGGGDTTTINNNASDSNDECAAHGAPLSAEGFALRVERLRVRAGGAMVAVVGPVGCGKSSLLSAVLGDMQLHSDIKGVKNGACSVASAPIVAYVPQRPWIASGTVADNILFGHSMQRSADALAAALSDSAFEHDLKLLRDGVHTEVGERGTTLSGGQAQRLAIARALFHCDRQRTSGDATTDNRLLLLDDPLAAVDSRVSKQIFSRLRARCSRIEAGGDGVSCLMALNQLQFLPQFDHILLLEGGSIIEQGTYEELVARGGAFASLMELNDGCNSSSVDRALARSDAANAAVAVSMDTHDGLALGDKYARDDEDGTVDGAQGGGTLGIVEGDSSTCGADDDHKLVREEQRQHGRVQGAVVLNFISAMRIYPLVVLLAVAAYGDMAFCDIHLSQWMMDFEALSDHENQKRAYTWIIACACQLFLIYSVSVGSAFGTTRAGRKLHNETISRLLKAPMRWFESTPSGRIVSRFSGDLSMIDYMFSNIIDDTTHFSIILLAVMGIIVWILPKLLPVLLVGFVCYTWLVLCVDRSNRECKRMVNNALSPLLTHVSEAATGRTLITTMGLAPYFEARYAAAVDEYNRYNYTSSSLEQWSVLATNTISFVASTMSCVLVLYDAQERSPVLAGLAVTYSFLLPYFLSMLSIMISMAFKAATSLERVCEYRGHMLPQEPAWHTQDDTKFFKEQSKVTGTNWPHAGRITFNGVALRYRPGLDLALRDASFEIEPGSRVGVVGRTGAGKSTLFVALFRLVELDAGTITIDGRSIETVGLQLLRRSIAIIPQQPLLIRGSVRRNLDPFNRATDALLCDVLAKVGLPASLLSKPVGEGAVGLSAGEAQLLSLARTLLRRDAVRILVMDEPTSNIDMVTDEKIQLVVREAFVNCTVLTVAHRLGTVIDSDKLLVMDAGRVIEYGQPHELLQRQGGTLVAMLEAMGKEAADKLRSRAQLKAEGGT